MRGTYLVMENDNIVLVTEATEPSDSYTEPVAMEIQTVIVQDLEQYANDMIHANLFGDFLICGCLCAIALFRWARK